jgi:hypothetical protein
MQQQQQQQQLIGILVGIHLKNEKYYPFILSSFFFIIIHSDQHLFIMNMEIHNFITRNNSNLHLSITNMTKFQKGVY